MLFPHLLMVAPVLLSTLNRRRAGPLKVKFSTLLGAVYVTLTTHPLMDYTNSYGWRPFLPFQDHWYYGDLVFIVDPYIWLILGGAVFLTVKRSLVTRLFWVAGVAFLSLLVVRHGILNPEGRWLPVVWFTVIFVLLIVKSRHSAWPRSHAVFGLLGLFVYWVLLSFAHHYALTLAYPEISQCCPQVRKEEIAATPRLANPFDWDLLFQDDRTLYYTRLSLFGKRNPGFQRYRRNSEDPVVQAALSTCPGSVMAQFARYEFFEVTHRSEGPVVILRDARYTRERTSGFGVLQIPMNQDLSHDLVELPCPGKNSPKIK